MIDSKLKQANGHPEIACSGRLVAALFRKMHTCSNGGEITADSGDLTISADWVNAGTIDASGADKTITLSGFGPRSGSTGDWKITPSGATLKFNTTDAVAIQASAGDFIIEDGTLDIDQSVDFSGGLKQTGGTIDVASGKTFNLFGIFVA